MKRFLAAALAVLSLCVFAQGTTPPPIAAKAYIVVDLLSGQTLVAANENDRLEPASLTKMMTGYVVYTAMRERRFDPGKPITVSANAASAGGSRMYLTAGQAVAAADLIRGMVVQSGNDAAIALAEAVAGSEDAFVQLMNQQAARMGLTGTHFANATGKPAPEHYSTARDLATLAAALIRDFPEQYAQYSQKDFTFNGIAQTNRNRLLWTDPTVDGVKTGFTEAAGYGLVASARRNGRRLVSVVLGAQSDGLRTSESQKLLNFAFQAYDTRLMFRKGEPVARPEIYKGTKSSIAVGFERDVWLTLPRERFTGLAATLETRQPFVAPLAQGEKAGIMKLTRDNAPLAEYPVVALEEVPVAGFLSRGWDTLRLMFR